MNVTFKAGETVNGFMIKTTNGLSQFVAENEDVIICFNTDAGAGTNYSKILWFTNKHSNRQYRAMKYLIKYVSTVQGFSNTLFQKYKQQNA